jgi:plant G-box-binding factor
MDSLEYIATGQAYYGVGPMRPPFLAMTPASPTPNPYLWGTQVNLALLWIM